jgi:hypothetical protein
MSAVKREQVIATVITRQEVLINMNKNVNCESLNTDGAQRAAYLINQFIN